jgi:outer membrane protein OmpA-like peptidoglycan-associated protein
MVASSRVALLFGVVLAVVGCAAPDGKIASPEPVLLDDADFRYVELDAVRAMVPQGAPFSQGLRVGYLDLAEEAGGRFDLFDRGHFARKAVASAKGQNVQPDMLALRRIPQAAAGELEAARARLLAALDANGRRTAPADAAKAQTAFDCWLERTEAGDQAGIAACKARFEEAIAAVERALGPGAAQQYLIFFAWDRADISPVALQVIEQVAADFKAGRMVRLHLAGHADRSGPADYNMRLSERRARAVARELERLGVPTGALDLKWFGETRPKVPTADGVREAQNRRVEVTWD